MVFNACLMEMALDTEKPDTAVIILIIVNLN